MFKAGWHFSMHDTFTCCHPLDITGSNHTSVTLEVFVSDLTLQHVGNCLKSTVWMVGESSRQLNIKQIKH
jgi:hypothetical protein